MLKKMGRPGYKASYMRTVFMLINARSNQCKKIRVLGFFTVYPNEAHDDI